MVPFIHLVPAKYHHMEPPPPGRAEVARFARLALVGKSAGHQLVSPADLPTQVSQLVNAIFQLLISREILPTHSSIYLSPKREECGSS